MRKFRFIGDSSDWEWDINPIRGSLYTLDALNEMRGGDPVDDDLIDCEWGKENFQEVFEYKNYKIPILGYNNVSVKKLHKDTDLGYFAGVALQGMMSNTRGWGFGEENLAKDAVSYAKELIKQLDQEAK